ncbi:MAG: aryl-sulfate sulfotransferase, partial [candidate division Zixibacteria bacterium]|nr:aryl-sulfate sulfotransferase [candidate division Zixibacteria bacterium]
MNIKKIIIICAVIVSFLGLVHSNAHGSLPANFPTVTTHIYDANVIADGYTFLAVAAEVEGIGYYVMIVDNDGNILWYKEANDDEIYDFKVLPNGHLHYAAFIEPHSWTGGGDVVHVILDENFNEVEVIEAGNGYVAEGHDFQMLPNGHALLIGYYMSEVDMSQIVDGGHPGAIVSGAIVQELDGNKDNRNVVFQWRTWDYYPFEGNISSTRAVINAFHFNVINQDFDGQLFTSGIRKLNRQTGEIIYNLGGSENEFTFVGPGADYSHIGGHGFHRLANGNVMNYDNGSRKGSSSQVHEYAIDEPNKIATHVWTYKPVPSVPAWHRGNAKRLPNGNTFIGWGGASANFRPIPTCTEVSPDDRKVFEIYFDHPDVESYRAFRFPYPPSSQAIEDIESEVAAGNTYVFDDTGVAIEVIDLTGDVSNEVKVTREPYAPVYPEFADKAPRVLQVRVKVA